MKQGKKNAWERYLEFTIEDWENFRIPHNRVLVELNPEETERTIGGIIVVKEHNFAAHATRRGIVKKTPHSLVCNINQGETMPWETDMELKIGDEVYMTFQDSNYGYPFTYKGNYMRMIDYSGILLAKRDKEIIMCNGYVLLEKIINKKTFGAYTKEEEDPNFAIVHAIGKPNRRIKGYDKHLQEEVFTKDVSIDLKIGDKVYINDHTRVFDLEDFAHANFDNRKIYKVCSRRRIAAIIEHTE
jgi:co-chaperonin GroES (HSP10)